MHDKTNRYLIDVPPTFSGPLHMSHLFSYLHMDFIARYQRYIKGKYLVYPYCYDNGLSMERAGIQDTEGEATASYYLFMRLGMAYSWHHYHTFQNNAVRLAEQSFADLVNKGLAYKGERGWCIRFLDHLPRIRRAIEAIHWKPEKYRDRLLTWLDQFCYDWSISRERNFGIAIPGETGQVFHAWHISSLSPQLAWQEETECPGLACPVFDVRFQTYDSIQTCALYTIIKSLYHNDQLPWRSIIISGHALAVGVQTPDDFIKQYTADGVRFWAAQPPVGSDAHIDTAVMEQGKRLSAKLLNTGRFLKPKEDEGRSEAVHNEWLECKAQADAAFERYDWPDALAGLTSFFWSRFCVHIEESKKEPIYGTLKEVYGEMLPYFGVFMPGVLTHGDK